MAPHLGCLRVQINRVQIIKKPAFVLIAPTEDEQLICDAVRKMSSHHNTQGWEFQQFESQQVASCRPESAYACTWLFLACNEHLARRGLVTLLNVDRQPRHHGVVGNVHCCTVPRSPSLIRRRR